MYITVYGSKGVSDVLTLGEAGGDDFAQGKETNFTVSIYTSRKGTKSESLISVAF